MFTPKELIASGLLELYVMGAASEEEKALVTSMAAAFDEVAEEIAQIEADLEKYAFENAIAPDPLTKVLIDAAIDYATRLSNGEPVMEAPLLYENSSPEDFSVWLDRPDMFLPEEAENLHVKILSRTPQVTTVVLWVRKYTPEEKHHNESERFLILEGSCEIDIEGEKRKLYPGDFIAIPLHKSHKVHITSLIPCKAILQRIAV